MLLKLTKLFLCLILMCHSYALYAQARLKMVGIPFATGGTVPRIVAFSPNVGGNLFAAVTNQNSDSVSVYTVNTTTGIFSFVDMPSTGDAPFGVAFSPLMGSNLFAAVTNQNSDSISVYSVNTTSGVFSLIGTVVTGGLNNPQGIAFSPDLSGNLFAAAANRDSSTVSVYSVDPMSGAFSPVVGSPFSTGGSSSRWVAFSPLMGSNVFAAIENGSNSTSVYSVDQMSGVFAAVPGSPFSTTAGSPACVALSPDIGGNLFAAIPGPGFDIVGAFQVNTSTGAFVSAGSSSASSTPAIAAYAPELGGNFFVAVSLLNGDMVGLYEVNNTTGVLTEVINSPFPTSGSSPFGVAFSPNIGNNVFAAAANQSSNTLTVYQLILAPTVTMINPTEGPESGGTSVTVTGTDFIDISTVLFGTTPAASFTVDTPTQITATSPPGTGTVDITVTTPAGTSAASSADQFTYIPRPIVSGLCPPQGTANGGTTIIITGVNFTDATSVLFGATPAASYTVDSSVQITAISPSGTGTVNITVTTIGGTSATSSADQFTYLVPSAGQSTVVSHPTIVTADGVSTSLITVTLKSSGGIPVPDQTVTLTPNGGSSIISPPSAVTNCAGQAFFMVSDTVVETVIYTASTGAGAMGNASVTFTTELSASIGGVCPSQGPESGGTTVTIIGTNFTGATAVLFGVTPATSFIVDSATQIIAISPPGTGTVDITVTTLSGTSPTSPADQFTYIVSSNNNLRAVVKKNVFLNATDLIHQLFWNPTFGTGILGYRIYEGSQLVGQIEASGPYQIELHQRSKKKTYTYTLVTLTSSGEVNPVTIKVWPGE